MRRSTLVIGVVAAGILALAVVALGFAAGDDPPPANDNAAGSTSTTIDTATPAPSGETSPPATAVPGSERSDIVAPTPGARSDSGIVPAEPAPTRVPPVTSRPDDSVSSGPLLMPPVEKPPAFEPPTSPAVVTPPQGTKLVAAPIDRAEIVALESFPVQYAVAIQAGLPGGCARPAGYELTRAGDVIRIAVYNTMPEGNPICTAIYGMYDVNVSLGSDFEAGKTYTVQVNDKTLKLVAQ
jgi:hypothetical protein